ncbi:MAG TPA: thioredoxin domain-containing protein [Candidatus Paceibacterota bacterium]|nr:thioredoxin domain-containing protein [Candidatus Paceibacterota bacterium]
MAETSGGTFADKYLTPLAVLVGLILIAVAIAFGGKGIADNREGAPQGGAVDIQNVQTDASPYVGEENAPVVIAVWFDYQCPFCKRFELETLSRIYDEYVTNGQVRIVYKDYQFLGPDSATAALYARAVWEAYPDRFYEWFVAMAEAQDEEHGGFGDLASITELTKNLGGMDTDRISRLMSENKSEYEAAITADRAEGASFGINGTPGAIVGTSLIAGAQPYEKVKALVDAELAK